MTTRRKRQLFEELGLLDQTSAPTNPYVDLGIDKATAKDLLDSDNTGEQVRFIARALYRSLSMLYHPDSGRQPDRQKFEHVTNAYERITNASSANLSRWSKEDTFVSSKRVEDLEKANSALLESSTETLQRTLRLGRHGLHYSQLAWAQGLLVERSGTPFLVRDFDTYLQIQKGVGITPRAELLGGSSSEATLDVDDRSVNFHKFLRDNDNFGLAPGTGVGIYMDEDGRTTILEPDLSFIMDITKPMADLREEYGVQRESSRERISSDSQWAESAHPTLLTTTIGNKNDDHPTQTTIFPSQNRAQPPWQIPMHVIGHVGDPEFLQRIRSNNRMAGRAIASSSGTTANYFSLQATPTEQLITRDAQYSPLLIANKSLLLFDPSNQMPVATDARIIGIIGSHSSKPE